MRKISSHFEWDIRYVVRSQGIKTQAKFFELLSYLDADNEKSKTNKSSRNNDKTNEKRDQCVPPSQPQSLQQQVKPQFNASAPNRGTQRGADTKPQTQNQKSVHALEKGAKEKWSKNPCTPRQSDNKVQQLLDIRALDRKLEAYIQNTREEKEEITNNSCVSGLGSEELTHISYIS